MVVLIDGDHVGPPWFESILQAALDGGLGRDGSVYNDESSGLLYIIQCNFNTYMLHIHLLCTLYWFLVQSGQPSLSSHLQRESVTQAGREAPRSRGSLLPLG